MRHNLLRAAAVFTILAAPIAAQAYPGDNWNYAKDSWPLIEAGLKHGAPIRLSEGPAAMMSDAAPGTASQSFVVMGTNPDYLHFGKDDKGFLDRGSQY